MCIRDSPKRREPNTLEIDFCGIPGPLSRVMSINSFFFPRIFRISMVISGRIRCSSAASNELSTDSLTAVMMDRGNVSKPRKCLFFSKNSLMLACCIPDDFRAMCLALHGSRSSLRPMRRGQQAANRSGNATAYKPQGMNHEIPINFKAFLRTHQRG